MSLERLKKIRVILSILLLASFVAGAFRPAVLLVGIAGVLGWLVFGAVYPSVKRAAKAVQSRSREGVAFELLPPPERYRGRSAVPFAALVRQLEDAQLGKLEPQGDRAVRLVTRAGDWLTLSGESAAASTLSNVRLASSSADLAAFACDALASRLGPITFRVDGIELLIDGTLPPAQLERELHDRRVERMHQLKRELNAIAPHSGSARPQGEDIAPKGAQEADAAVVASSANRQYLN